MGHARSLSFVEDVTIFGNALHLLVHSNIPDEKIVQDLEKASSASVTVRPIEPTLEDVFVRLTKLQSDKNAKGDHAA